MHPLTKTENRNPQPAEKSASETSQSAEKEAVTILDAEKEAWSKHIGSLGSITTTYQERTTQGLGAEWREPAILDVRSTLVGTQTPCILSENVTRLLNLYHRLGSDKERSRLVLFLLGRLSRNSTYAPVGYLILLFLFRIGRLPEGLNKAKTDLQGDPAYGFSDLIRLLDGLLRFELSSFAPSLIDAVEQFIDDLAAHTFRIQERIAAIRAFRLANQPVV